MTTSERKFVSGISRVRDGQTLILTGVISDRESSTTWKVPILGDIPIFEVCLDSTTDRKKKELVLTVTPRVIKDNQNHMVIICLYFINSLFNDSLGGPRMFSTIFNL